MTKKEPNQPLSAQAYAFIALLGLGIGVVLLFFYVHQVPKLVEGGTQNQFFYLLLIPWALSCAAFLFGAMRSYARFAHRQLGNALELGGPVVLFSMVIVGGFRLVPSTPESFDLTIRAHSADGTVPLVTSGRVTLELDTLLRREDIAPNGEANFKGIPERFKGATVRLLPEVAGYKTEWQQHKLLRYVLDLPLEPAAQPTTHLRGWIDPPPPNWSKIRIVVQTDTGQTSDGTVDERGRFDFPVKGRDRDGIRLRIYAGDKLVYDKLQTLPGPGPIKLDRVPR